MPKRVISYSECDSTEDIQKLFQELFDKQAENDEYNAEVDVFNEEVMKGGD
jgi:hypothetical protein